MCHADTQFADSKIDLLDSEDAIRKKISKAECAPKVVEGNGVLAFTEFVLLPAAALRGKKEFVVPRRDDTPLVYTSIEQMHDDFKNDKVRIPVIVISYLPFYPVSTLFCKILTFTSAYSPSSEACCCTGPCRPHCAHSRRF